MNNAQRNHLRRLNAWVRAEIGPSPEELRETFKDILPIIEAVAVKDAPGLPTDPAGRADALLTDAAKARMVKSYDKAKAVPQAVRDAVAAIERHLSETGKAELDVEALETGNRIATGQGPEFDALKGLNRHSK